MLQESHRLANALVEGAGIHIADEAIVLDRLDHE
jgi:hypothetical protein